MVIFLLKIIYYKIIINNFNNKINWYFIRLIGLINNLSFEDKKKKTLLKEISFSFKRIKKISYVQTVHVPKLLVT